MPNGPNGREGPARRLPDDMTEERNAAGAVVFADEVPASAMFDAAWRFVRASGRLIAADLAAEGFADLGPAHCALLYRLHTGPARITDLAQRGAVTRQAMSLLVEQLHAAGYAERRPDPADRRARIVVLTDRGRLAAGSANRSLARLVELWLGRVGSSRMQECVNALCDMTAAIADAPSADRDDGAS